MTDAEVQAMRERNAQRANILKRALGVKYACHPVNQVQRVDAPGRRVQFVSVVVDRAGLVQSFTTH